MERYLNHSIIIQNLRIFLADIEVIVNRWGWLIVVDLENGGQAADEHVVRIFEVSLKSWLLKSL